MEHLYKIKIGDKIYSLGIDSLSAEEVIYDPTETYASGTVGAELTQHSTDIVNLENSKENKGKCTINGTEYTLRIGSSGANGYITFVLEN